MHHSFLTCLTQFQHTRFSRMSCLVVALIIFFMMVVIGSLPGEANALSAVVPDKLLHFSAYAVMSGLIYSGLEGNKIRRAIATILLTGLLGGLDEGIQLFLPYRNAGIDDWGVDMLATFFSVSVLSIFHGYHESLKINRSENE